MQIQGRNIAEAIQASLRALECYGEVSVTKSWQGRNDVDFSFLELINLSLKFPMSNNLAELERLSKPTMPWAEDHFRERVSGQPLNPPPSHKQWLTKTEDYLSDSKKFSHSYPERLWPKGLTKGIRFDTADLHDAVKLLKANPTTRQCFVPIYFPEDLTAALQNERVPCTIGWHFIIRQNQVHVFYPMRACDALRHFHNDLYFANRLAIWIKDQAGLDEVEMGHMHFSCTSFHCFVNDKYALNKAIK